ncbi:MAG: hypothetical protein ACE14M_08775 [Terriglobales bacterium]
MEVNAAPESCEADEEDQQRDHYDPERFHVARTIAVSGHERKLSQRHEGSESFAFRSSSHAKKSMRSGLQLLPALL